MMWVLVNLMACRSKALHHDCVDLEKAAFWPLSRELVSTTAEKGIPSPTTGWVTAGLGPDIQRTIAVHRGEREGEFVAVSCAISGATARLHCEFASNGMISPKVLIDCSGRLDMD